MIIYFSGDAFGYNFGPERLIPEMKPDLMMTFWNLTPRGQTHKGIMRRFERHVKRRKKKRRAKD